MAEGARTLTYEELLSEYQRVQEELAQLKRLIFGQKRERFVPLANERQLAITLEYVPPELYVKHYIRSKYAKPEGEGIAIAELPTRPIEKGRAGAGLLAQVLISKFVDHLPLYRQQQQLRRQKINNPESTLGGWVKTCSEALLPLYETHRALIQHASYLMVDETPLPVLDRTKPGKTHLGYHWMYFDPVAKLVLFEYRLGRSRAGPNDILKDFQRYLQCDGYTGYDDILARHWRGKRGCRSKKDMRCARSTRCPS